MSSVLQPNQPIRFEGRNARPGFRRLKTGDIYTLNIEITEDDWNSLKTVPENALLEVVMWHHSGDEGQDSQPTEPKADKAEPKERGPWGSYWQQLFKKGFQNYPDLIQVLDCAGDQIRLRLHDVFSTDTLTTVSPTDFEQFLESEGLTSLITLSRQAQAHLAEVRSN